MLRTHVSTVRRLERSGQLHPRKTGAGEHRFDRAEVEALARAKGIDRRPTDRGQLYAAVWQGIREAKSLADLVIELGAPPDELAPIVAEYHATEIGPDVLVLSRAELHRLAWVTGRNLRTGAELVELVRRLLLTTRAERRKVSVPHNGADPPRDGGGNGVEPCGK